MSFESVTQVLGESSVESFDQKVGHDDETQKRIKGEGIEERQQLTRGKLRKILGGIRMESNNTQHIIS